MNTFGLSGLQFPLYDAREPRDSRGRFRRDKLDLLARANSFYMPAGRFPSRGWVLLARADYDQLTKYSTDLVLHIGDTTRPDNVGALSGLSIVQAQCVTRGLVSDPAALYLVELTDARGILYNRWFQFPLISSYNERAPGYPETFYLNSMKDYPAAGAGSKTTWTWSTLIGDLWSQMGTFLGAYPGLPYAPAGTPEGFDFNGVSAWEVLCDLLDHLGMQVACDLTKASPFTIVQLGKTDATFAALQSKYVPNLEDDLEWIDLGAARVPATVKVLFRRRNTIYGTEEAVTYRNDAMAQQWEQEATYSVSVAAPSAFSSAVGTHYIWSDFTVRYDMNSTILSADAATAATIAAERASQYFGRIYRQTLGRMTQTYAGALPFFTGSVCDGVCWYMDYSSQPRQGWKTSVVRGDDPPWPGLWDK